MRSLTRVSVLMGPPLLGLWVRLGHLGFCPAQSTASARVCPESAMETPHHQQKGPAKAGPNADRSRHEPPAQRAEQALHECL
jgi:hypothetical protein